MAGPGLQTSWRRPAGGWGFLSAPSPPSLPHSYRTKSRPTSVLPTPIPGTLGWPLLPQQHSPWKQLHSLLREAGCPAPAQHPVSPCSQPLSQSSQLGPNKAGPAGVSPRSRLCETSLGSPWGEEVGMALSQPVGLGIAHLIRERLQGVQGICRTING